jgi:flagellar protein FlaG
MSIPSISSSPVQTTDRSAAEPAAVALARAPASAVDTAAAVEKAAPVPTQAQVKEAVANINKSLQTLSQDLVFSVDQDTHRTIVKVIDQKTKEVLRQIPTPEAMEIAKALDTVRGLLIKQTA